VFFEESQIINPISVVEEDLLSPVAALDNVVGDAGNDNSSDSRQKQLLSLQIAWMSRACAHPILSITPDQPPVPKGD
jgi:hypothetical protein